MRPAYLAPIVVISLACRGQPEPSDTSEPTGTTEPSEHQVSVMSFNIRWDNPEDGDNRWPNRRPACAALLDDHAPDVVGFQEAQHHMVLALEADMPEYAWVGVGRDDGVKAGEFAPIFYRSDLFEVVDSGTFWLSETPEQVSVGWDAALERIVTWAALGRRDDGSAFYVFNTHFDHVGIKAREMSAALLASKIDEIAGGKGPVFVTGDLNAPLFTHILDALLKELSDARATAPETDDVHSFNAWGNPLWSIDYVFYRHAEALRFETVDDDYGVPWVSDHYPVVADFRYLSR